MKRIAKILLISTSFLLFTPISVSAKQEFCSDKTCKTLENLFYQQDFEQIVSTTNPAQSYSDGSVFYIGMAYTRLVGQTQSFDRKVGLYKKALQFKYYPAYTALFLEYRKRNPSLAMSYLRDYIKTKPDDSEPYFYLGEGEFQKGHLSTANRYLRQAKALSNGHTAGLDWDLFQINYVLGHYRYAHREFESALAQMDRNDINNGIATIRRDPRFKGIEKLPEFRDDRGLLGGKN